MPLDSATAILKGTLSGAGILGTSSSQLAAGVGIGLATYGKSGMVVMTIDVGQAGAGTGIGVGIFLAPPLLISTLTPAFAAAGILGPSAPQIITGLSLGISSALAVAMISSINPTVGNGSGKVQIIPNTAAAVGVFNSTFKAAGLLGTMSPALATAVANGLNAALPLAQGFVVITGGGGTAAASGTGTARLL